MLTVNDFCAGTCGIYDGDQGAYIPDRIYHASPLASRSGAWKMHTETAADFKAWLDEPEPATNEMWLGRALHAAVLQPDVFETDWRWCPDDSRPTDGIDAKRRWWEWLAKLGHTVAVTEETKATKNVPAKPKAVSILYSDAASDVVGWNPDRNEFSGAHVDLAQRMLDAFDASAAKDYLDTPGPAEATIVVDVPLPGGETIRTRVRVDKINPQREGLVVFDYKTDKDNRRPAVERRIVDGWGMQAAMYSKCVELATRLPVLEFYFMVQRKSGAYGIELYPVDRDEIEESWEECLGALASIHECRKHDSYPDRSGLINEPLRRPTWARK